jgi:broad specificity phosphatase PhoE
MSLNIYFLRHGQTASSQANLFCGAIDPPLTTNGEEMARSFATAYASLPWQAMFCSPRAWAIATATPLAVAVNMELQIRQGLEEINYAIVRTNLWSQRAILEKAVIVRMGFNQSRVKS